MQWLISDHLGSTSKVLDAATGNLVAETRYTPWGEQRAGSGSLPTKYTYTGQYSNVADFGLLFYNARWYDPSLGRFASADTLIPNPGNPLDYDRYAYARNNPLYYTDTSGHNPECGPDGIWCDNDTSNDYDYPSFSGSNGPSAIDDSILDASVYLRSGGEALYSLYLDFKAASWWMKYSSDPLLLFLAYILSRESFNAWLFDDAWFSGDSKDPANLFAQAGATWFWSWGKAKQGEYGQMNNHADIIVMLFNWIDAGLQSADYLTLEGMRTTIGESWRTGFLFIASEIYDPTNNLWKQGNGMGSWANANLYKLEGRELLATHNVYEYGTGMETWYILSPDDLRLVDDYRCPNKGSYCD